MVRSEELDCAIYVEAPGRDALLALALELTGGRLEGATIEAADVELHIDDNDEADRSRAGETPDGFLWFSNRVEVFTDEPPATGPVTRLLERFWSCGWPAVAACDYEDELPRRGGYKSPDVPWPS